ncbi:hypothetical protein [Actinosynnema mirum]|uniref:Extracellular repeat protein, HAF family n=1 Tax=Actinosynnema mirum (strain ATCC 29888 / DSM 43827 / JCM 3225 / NBRC 14064 / NCIMB 13271 / NRRL B-12336 / IMRU 3971 / 101) TaxID=446462 RepID=C6WK02_ACTMD|nr:hypothetical protein [Actinosynnema mirum]ACU38215.1 hypothetical protein Amir_4366 [Actinosynnema mirum DSM 43827]
MHALAERRDAVEADPMRTRSRATTALLGAAALVLSLAPAAEARAASYLREPLQPASTTTNARDVNRAGVVVGNANGGPVRWAAGATWPTPLPTPPGTSGGYASEVNDSGVAVGMAGGAPVKWAADGTVEVLPVPPGYSGAVATGINEAGQVSGYANSPKDNPSTMPWAARWAVRWDVDGVMSTLAFPAGFSDAFGEDVGGDGTVVGWVASREFISAARWAPDGTITVLQSSGWSEARAANEGNVAVGFYAEGPARWNPDGTSTGYGLGGLALDVNAAGDVVGWASFAGTRHGFLARAGGGVTELTDLRSATAINDQGVLVGEDAYGYPARWWPQP